MCYSGADPRARAPAPTTPRAVTIQIALLNSIQAPVHHWAPTPGINPVSAPATGKNRGARIGFPKASVGRQIRVTHCAEAPDSVRQSLTQNSSRRRPAAAAQRTSGVTHSVRRRRRRSLVSPTHLPGQRGDKESRLRPPANHRRLPDTERRSIRRSACVCPPAPAQCATGRHERQGAARDGAVAGTHPW